MPKKDTNKLNYIVKPIDDLIPYARNARTHSEEQVNKIASSIKEFGFCRSGLSKKIRKNSLHRNFGCL